MPLHLGTAYQLTIHGQLRRVAETAAPHRWLGLIRERQTDIGLPPIPRL
jgi:hypothetical protein